MKANKQLFLGLAFFAAISFILLKTAAATIWLNIGYVHLNHVYAGNIEQIQFAERAFAQAASWTSYNERVDWALGQALLINETEEAVSIWFGNQLASSRLAEHAQIAEREQNWVKAQAYYHILQQLEAQNSDHWYHYGRMAQRLSQWPIALESHNRAIDLNAFTTIQTSDVYYQRGVVYQLGTSEVKNLALALQNYEQALKFNQFSSPDIKAESWYKIGEIYDWQGESADILVNIFSQALTINPDHNWARLRYGYTLYWSKGEIAPSKYEIQQVILSWEKSNNPSLKWSYRYLADIYADQEDWENATILYLRVLEIDPNDEYAQNKLAQINQR